MTQLGVFIPTIVAFCMWIHRAYRNLPALGAARLSYTPGWAVGYFFIPIANLFRPYQVTKEIWNNSAPLTADGITAGRPRGSYIVGIWWGFWIIANIVSNIAMRAVAGEGITELQAASWAEMFADALSLCAALAAILVVRRIDVMQETRAEQTGLLESAIV